MLSACNPALLSYNNSPLLLLCQDFFGAAAEKSPVSGRLQAPRISSGGKGFFSLAGEIKKLKF
jgi:hypothetical protein